MSEIFFFFRDYCNDLKISDNNTEFLLNFNEFIDRKTPNNPSCKYRSVYSNYLVSLLLYLVWSTLASDLCVSMLASWLMFKFLMVKCNNLTFYIQKNFYFIMKENDIFKNQVIYAYKCLNINRVSFILALFTFKELNFDDKYTHTHTHTL